MYNEFFGFDKNPFAIKPDPAFFFNSKQHDAALRGLMFAVHARMGLISLTGEGGTGKTLVLDYLRDSLEANNIHCAFLRESRISVSRFFANIASELDLPGPGSSAYQMFSALYQMAIQQAQRGRTVVLIVDDAHDLPADVFNEILHLASLHDQDVKLVQTILAGRPELQPTLDKLNLERLSQRAIVNLVLRPFDALETQEYIEFRLEQAGMRAQKIFPPEAMFEIQHRSGGIAPAIQALCDRLLLAAFSARSKTCTQEILDQVFQNPPGKPKIVDHPADAVPAARIDLARLAAPPEPEPPPMTTSLSRLVFDPRFGALLPRPVILTSRLSLQSIGLELVAPVWSFELPVAELAIRVRTPMRIQIPAKRPAPATGLRGVSLAPVRSTEVLLRHPSASAGEESLTRVPDLSRPIPSACHESSGKPMVRVQAAAPSSFAAAAIQPIHAAEKIEFAKTDEWPHVPVTPFKISECDPHSPAGGGDVQMLSANLENPIGPEAAAELVPSCGAVREQNNLLPVACSVASGLPLSGMTSLEKTDFYIEPPLEAWCPPSGLEPVDARPSLHLLSTGTPPAAFIEVPHPPSSGKWFLNVAILFLAVLAVYIAPPTIAIAANSLHRAWQGAHQALLDRAAVAFNEDFRSGLDDWMNRGGGRPSWTSDAAGFVHPRTLALYRPSLSLTDYQLQFVGTIDQKALSWVVRAADFNNYYALRLAVLKPGPTPAIGVIRYAVIDGKIHNQVTTPLLMSARSDTVYNVHLDVHGDRFALTVQDQLVDSWSEPKLQRGGIGFFSESDAASRVAGVQVRGQFDMLGRVCAFLLPSGVTTYRTQLNELAAVAVRSEMSPGDGRGGSYVASPEHSATPFDSSPWPAPEMTLLRRINCAPRARSTGVTGARSVTRRTGVSAAANCY